MRDFIPNMYQAELAPIDPLTREHKKRQELFRLYWEYYRGLHRKGIKTDPQQPDDNVVINWSKKVVNQGINFLFGKPLSFQIDDSEERSQAELYLDDLWNVDLVRQFDPQVFLKKLAQNGAVTGTAFARLYVDNGGKPYLRAFNPEIAHIITDPNDVDAVIEKQIVWRVEKEWHRHRYIRNDNGAWDYAEEIWARNNWRTEFEEAWAYDFCPIFHCQNLILANAQWGISDLEDADLNDAINFVASNINRITRFHAHPKTIGVGFRSGSIETTSVDQFWTIPQENARVFNLEMQSDLSSSRAHKQDLEEGYHQVTDIPRMTPESVNLGALSGFALKILYGPLMNKTEDKRGTYGNMLQQINRAFLVLGGYEDEIVTNVWQSPLPSDEREKIERFVAIAGATGGNINAAATIAGFDRQQIELLTQNDFNFGITQ